MLACFYLDMLPQRKAITCNLRYALKHNQISIFDSRLYLCTQGRIVKQGAQKYPYSFTDTERQLIIKPWIGIWINNDGEIISICILQWNWKQFQDFHTCIIYGKSVKLMAVIKCSFISCTIFYPSPLQSKIKTVNWWKTKSKSKNCACWKLEIKNKYAGSTVGQRISGKRETN